MPLTKEQRDWLALTLIPGVGTAMFVRLLARFHSPGHVLRASRVALEEVVGRKLAERIAEYSDVTDIVEQEHALDQWGARLITMEDEAYPFRLAEIYDPPLALFVRGALNDEDRHCVAIVGTRRASPYGIRMAEKFARELAGHGVTIVSGMAAGIDAAAHRGAIAGGGRTIAVLGCGVDVVYPPQHADLMNEIIAHGCVMSQFPMGTKPSAGHFPYRNRIISGIAAGTVIVEAPLSSGALITARQAAEQGREVFAVPGNVGMENSRGPHALIREGAKLIENVEDILVELELPATLRPCAPSQPAQVAVDRSMHIAADTPPSPAPPAAAVATGRERAVLSALQANGSHVDEIADACRLSVSEALSTLTLLELKGLVRQFSGKRFAPR
jgi:DNA processing protein